MTHEPTPWRTEARRRWQQLCAQFSMRNHAANVFHEKTRALVVARDQARDRLEKAERVLPLPIGDRPREDVCIAEREALALADRNLAEHKALVDATVPPFDAKLFNALDAAIKKLDEGAKPADRIGEYR